jgi:MoxR-like ATPase
MATRGKALKSEEKTMTHVRPFTPKRVERHDPLPSGAGGDDRDGRVYVYHRSDIALAVNVALATHRPLLLSGPSGCGKSCLALNAALYLRRRYYEYVVTARSEARDLLWRFDSLQRLNDAQAHKIKPDESYVEPGRLWWAFDRESAGLRGTDPSPVDGDDAVVLIDEIDKADPDLPNNLLVALGSMEFKVAPTGFVIKGERPPLIFITTNRERELPRAFVRRCVALELPSPSVDELVEIAKAVLPDDKHDDDLFRRVGEHALGIIQANEDDGGGVSTAEYLDTLKACIDLDIDVDHQDFADLTRITLNKKGVQGEAWA